jgi:pimeloyl-ACP methyl ester carboxylesterase
MWDDTLLARFRMVGFDRPGFGYSDFGEALHTADQAELLALVLKRLQNGKPFILCGHSMGAPVAVQIAADYPELVDKLVLIGAPLDVRLEKKESWRHLMNNKPLYYALPGAFGPSNTELLYLKTDLLELQNQYHKIRCDVEFIHGAEDDWVPIENIVLGKQTMTNARSIRIDTIQGAGHLIPWKNEETFRKLLRKLKV